MPNSIEKDMHYRLFRFKSFGTDMALKISMSLALNSLIFLVLVATSLSAQSALGSCLVFYKGLTNRSLKSTAERPYRLPILEANWDNWSVVPYEGIRWSEQIFLGPSLDIYIFDRESFNKPNGGLGDKYILRSSSGMNHLATHKKNEIESTRNQSLGALYENYQRQSAEVSDHIPDYLNQDQNTGKNPIQIIGFLKTHKDLLTPEQTLLARAQALVSTSINDKLNIEEAFPKLSLNRRASEKWIEIGRTLVLSSSKLTGDSKEIKAASQFYLAKLFSWIQHFERPDHVVFHLNKSMVRYLSLKFSPQELSPRLLNPKRKKGVKAEYAVILSAQQLQFLSQKLVLVELASQFAKVKQALQRSQDGWVHVRFLEEQFEVMKSFSMIESWIEHKRFQAYHIKNLTFEMWQSIHSAYRKLNLVNRDTEKLMYAAYYKQPMNELVLRLDDVVFLESLTRQSLETLLGKQ